MKWHWDNFLSPYTRFQTHAQQMRQSPEEKAKIAIEAIKGEMTMAQISSKYGIH